ncbi:hypothetical protein OV203_21285 [Nannocystis sp. ILAH1]|uniref:hypothetical protein n=1 Tax=Nannocystis sp. ILAH1 TaxID=2996789 RepID=UPI00226F5FA4|nr:hypothetical protein [Nannocystis sp. ILAH1]MCY0989686.1 hypothetical protein [Nannocystis sp. ILAH1]
MRITLLSLLALSVINFLPACGDTNSGTESNGTVSASATGSQTDAGTDTTVTPTPTTGVTGEASDTQDDDGTASLSATGTGASTNSSSTSDGTTGSSDDTSSSTEASTSTSDGTTGSSDDTSSSTEASTSTSDETTGTAAGSETTTASESTGDTGQGVNVLMNPFDLAPGMNTYVGGLSDDNWGTELAQPNAGGSFFGSANGNQMGSFAGLGLTKDLGGVVEDTTYEVSFFVTMYVAGFSGIELADFSTLRIGGPGGMVEWTSTPTPTVEDEWVQWTGMYTPAPADLGGPFIFEMVFDLDAQHAVGFDGVVSAVPLP